MKGYAVSLINCWKAIKTDESYKSKSKTPTDKIVHRIHWVSIQVLI